MLRCVTAASHLDSSLLAEDSVLARWNTLPVEDAEEAILPCCGSRGWARTMAAGRPIADEAVLLERSDAVWQSLAREDWQEAFDSHPRLGESDAKEATADSLRWSSEEQSKAAPSDALRAANRRYEEKFGRIFLLCASGRTTAEILAAMEQRMHNDAETEWREAGEQQRQITRLRLQRWLRSA